MSLPSSELINQQVEQALREDVGSGDLTAALIAANAQQQARVISRQDAVIAGQAWFDCVFAALDPAVEIDWHCADGERVDAGQQLVSLHGSARALLTGERTALNFLQTLSAVATRTRQFVDAVAGTGVNILDTRKTIPGLRLAQKYAVTCGGGVNHRVGLYDAVLIKENHIAAAGSIAAALLQARQTPGQTPSKSLAGSQPAFIEVEVESLDELRQAIEAGAERLLLDNFSVDQLSEAVRVSAGRARLEASGNVSLATVREIAATGVDDISVGELTKHLQATDLSMRFY